MIAADKEALQSELKQSALLIRSKELTFFTNNFQSLGTQAAVCVLCFCVRYICDHELILNRYLLALLLVRCVKWIRQRRASTLSSSAAFMSVRLRACV
jgi:hypothetical protein